MTKGDMIWFDSEGIGADTPLSYFGWDFDECAVIENIDKEKVTLSIKVRFDENGNQCSGPNEKIQIVAPRTVVERLIQKPFDRIVEFVSWN